MNKTEEILNEREKTHGDFEEVANLAYNMKKAIDSYLAFDRKGPDDNNKVLKKKHLISINMILLKIARIICGDPNFADHWDDIAGYAMLGKGKEEGLKCGCFKDGIGLMTFLCEEHAKERREKTLSTLSGDDKEGRKPPMTDGVIKAWINRMNKLWDEQK